MLLMDRAQSGASCSGRELPVAPRLRHHQLQHRAPGLARSPPASRKPAVQAACGLKKQEKKLSMALKAHRKRLDAMMESLVPPQAPAVPGAAAAAAAAAPAATAEQLGAILAEVRQLQAALAELRQRRDADGDSSSSDESDDEQRRERRRRRQLADLAAGSSSRPALGVPVVAAAAAAAALAPPPVDLDDAEGLDAQLPPPAVHADAAGRVLVCQGKACMARGALGVLRAAAHAASASPGVEVLPCKCLGKCKQGPALRLRSDAQQGCTLLTEVAPLEVPEAVDQYFGGGGQCA